MVPRLAIGMLAAVFTVCAAEPGKPGSTLATIQVTDLAGNPAKLSTAGKVTAVVFLSAKCPVSNEYNQRMQALYKQFEPKGVQFVFVNANFNETNQEIEQHAKDSEFTFRVWRDANGALADALKADVTPEAIVFDRKGTIVYHGAIDDARNPARVTQHSLKDALAAALDGKAPAVKETKAFGCTIKRARKAAS